MFKLRVTFLLMIIIFSAASIGQAATLNLGQDVYQLQITNFNPQSNMGDFVTLNLGYGVDDYSGYGLEVVTGNKIGIAQLEYQFIPAAKRKKKQSFNYAFKAGAVSGNYWKEDEPGGKLGLVLQRKKERKQIYFDGDLITGQTTLFDLEFGLRGELAPDILGVIGYKVIASQDQGNIKGAHYGLKVNF